MNYSLGNMLNGGESLNADGLSLDLQFATDKTLTARKGPTPTFTRASNATYYGPLVNFGGETYPTTGIVNGRAEWKIVNGSNYKSFEYTGSVWRYTEFFSGEGTTFDSAATSVFRPEQANWSGSGLTSSPTTSSTFGIVRSAINEPRFDHATTAPNACLGLLIEETRTNLVFPSDTLTTQTRTVTAVAHTLSFYGTGTVVLSGVATATVTGTGAFPTRTTLTFTPTAGSLIMTVTGSVTQAQLEAGSFATSYIPTTTASVVRSVDVCSITGANFSGFYNQSEGTAVMKFTNGDTSSYPQLFTFNQAASPFANRIYVVGYNRMSNTEVGIVTASTNQMSHYGGLTNKSGNIAIAYKTNDAAYARGGSIEKTDNTVTLGTLIDRFQLQEFNGCITSFSYFKKRLANSKLQTLTT